MESTRPEVAEFFCRYFSFNYLVVIYSRCAYSCAVFGRLEYSVPQYILCLIFEVRLPAFSSAVLEVLGRDFLKRLC
jgi:hypothetical protein